MSVKPHEAVPRAVLTVPLPPAHHISINFLVPPILHLTIYILELSSSITLCWNLNKIGIPALTGITVLLVFLPALVTTSALLIHGSKEKPLLKKIISAVVSSIFFPFWAIYRLSYRIFWAIEAILILHSKENTLEKEQDGVETRRENWGKRGEEVEEALALSVEPSSAELYLFLRAFLYSLPNSLLHSCIILAAIFDIVKGYETYAVQTASILFSWIYLSMTAAFYQFFESQRLLGRNFPWRGKNKQGELKKWLKRNQNDEKEEDKGEEAEAERELIPQKTDIKEEIPKKEEESEVLDKVKHESTSSSPTGSLSSLRVTLRRHAALPGAGGTYQGLFHPIPNEPAPPPPPKVRSPRIPGGFKDIFCDTDSSVTTPRVSREQSFRSTIFSWPPMFKTNRQSVRSGMDATQPHASVPQGVFPAIPVPTRAKDPPKIIALERDDFLGLTVSFFHWLFIISARALSLATAMKFFLRPTIGVCAGHVLLVILWLLHREGRPYFQIRKLALRCLLALTTLSGILLELGSLPFLTKALFFHDALIFLEDLGLGLGWMMLPENDSWWNSYTFYTSLGAHILSLGCAIFYTFALKPRKHILPQEESLIISPDMLEI